MAISEARWARMLRKNHARVDRDRSARLAKKRIETAENLRFRNRHQKWDPSEPRSIPPSNWLAFEEAVRKWGMPAGFRTFPPWRL